MCAGRRRNPASPRHFACAGKSDAPRHVCDSDVGRGHTAIATVAARRDLQVIEDDPYGRRQIGTCQWGADLALSSDEAFVRITNRVKDDSPFPIAPSRIAPAGAIAVDAVMEAFEVA